MERIEEEDERLSFSPRKFFSNVSALRIRDIASKNQLSRLYLSIASRESDFPPDLSPT